MKPQPVTPEFLTTHMPELAKDDAAANIVAALKEKQLLDGAGLLQRDPRRSDWRDVLKASSIPGGCCCCCCCCCRCRCSRWVLAMALLGPSRE